MTGMTVAQVTRACAPFLIPLIASLLTITYLPEVVLWLPRIVFG
jgi:C4-dicarboxylate transporter DctM subunit